MALWMLSAVLGTAVAVQPHIVLMVLDDVGWADVGYHGSDFPTPVIDRLATEEGVRLERFYVQQVCSPTRSALMTGRYPFHTGMQQITTLLPGTTAALPMEVPTIAEVLKEKGYRTHAIGKWHLGQARWKNTPTGRGFDSHLGYFQGACDYYNKTVGFSTIGAAIKKYQKVAKFTTGFDFWANRTSLWEESAIHHRYSVDAYQKEAKRVLDNHDPAQPLFLYFAHQNIHEPLQYPPEAVYAANCKHVAHTLPAEVDRNTLCAMMNRLDAAIGEFETLLKKKDMWDNTVLWVVSDNGGMTKQGVRGLGGSASSNYPLRAGKTTLFEGGVRVPSFVTGGLVPKQALGSAVTGLLQHVDIPTTLAALAGTNLSSKDGFNVWDAVTSGAPSPRTEVPLNVDTSVMTFIAGLTGLCQGGSGQFSGLIQNQWKLITSCSGASDGWTSNDPYHITPPNASQGFQKVDGSRVYLFDIIADPTERNNLASANPAMVHSMLSRLKELADPKQGYKQPQRNSPHPRSLPGFHNGTWAPFLSDDEEVTWEVAEHADEESLIV